MEARRPRPLSPSTYTHEILSIVPELRQIAEIELEILCNTDSSNIGPPHWRRLAGRIFEALDHFDGFVVLHGTDTMAYTATALSFMLRNLPKPVILTGSQRPLAELRSDARSNLVTASILATMEIPEVVICFGDQALRGNRSTKIDLWHYDAFASPNCPPLAQIGLDIELSDHILKPSGAPALHTELSTNVAFIKLFPGMRTTAIERVLECGIEGIVLEAFGAGNIPVESGGFLELIARCTGKGIPVVITSQCLYGGVDLSLYACGEAAAQAGALSAGDMTSEAALLKLKCLIARTGGDYARIAAGLGEPWAGEITR